MGRRNPIERCATTWRTRRGTRRQRQGASGGSPGKNHKRGTKEAVPPEACMSHGTETSEPECSKDSAGTTWEDTALGSVTALNSKKQMQQTEDIPSKEDRSRIGWRRGYRAMPQSSAAPASPPHPSTPSCGPPQPRVSPRNTRSHIMLDATLMPRIELQPPPAHAPSEQGKRVDAIAAATIQLPSSAATDIPSTNACARSGLCKKEHKTTRPSRKQHTLTQETCLSSGRDYVSLPWSAATCATRYCGRIPPECRRYRHARCVTAMHRLTFGGLAPLRGGRAPTPRRRATYNGRCRARGVSPSSHATRCHHTRGRSCLAMRLPCTSAGK